MDEHTYADGDRPSHERRGYRPPAGCERDNLTPTDYLPVEIVEEKVHRAAIHRPGNAVLDLPAGSSAANLSPADYHVVEIEEDE